MNSLPKSDGTELAWRNGLYSIKQHGVSITNCESEPVHTPGCIQSHGALLVLRKSDLTILQVSENSEAILAHAPEQLLGEPVKQVIGTQREVVLTKFIEEQPVEANSVYIFSISDEGRQAALDVSVHTMGELVLLEFEAITLKAEERKLDYAALVKNTVNRLHNAKTLSDLCEIAANELRAITGLDRIMVYRFHADQHGEVIAESKRSGIASYLGLHYPAEDIPLQAREIFKRIPVRPMHDSASLPVEMVPLANPDTGKPLDMTYCVLRGASVMYTEYLRNMGVAASLTLPIMVKDELWGLFASNHLTPKEFPHEVRTACVFVAQVVQLQLKWIAEREQLEYRLRIESIHQKQVATAARLADFSVFTSKQSSLLDGIDCKGVALYYGKKWWVAGSVPTTEQLDQLNTWLGTRAEFDSITRPVYVTETLPKDYPAALEFSHIASGLIAVPISRSLKSMMMWFRPETVHTVKWAGDPNEKLLVPGPHGIRLTPRRSFELFLESVQHRSRPWLAVEVDAAVSLRFLMLDLVISRLESIEFNAKLMASNEELERAKVAAELANKAKTTFLSSMSHELRTPLNAILGYAQLIETDDPLPPPHQLEYVQQILGAGWYLLELISDILDMALIESGKLNLIIEPISLIELMTMCHHIIEPQAAAKGISVRFNLPPNDFTVKADRKRTKQVFINILSNAVKYNRPNGSVTVECRASFDDRIRISVRDTGAGISPEMLGQLFQAFNRLGKEASNEEGTGIGLALSKRLVEGMGGVIGASSEVNVGSEFWFDLLLSD